MSYEKVNPIQQFNFQINRVLTYGSLACDCNEVKEKTSSIRTIDDWEKTWLDLAERAELEQRYLHSAYYYRMVEFFMIESKPEKNIIYEKCIKLFHLGFFSELRLHYEQYIVPFEGKVLNCIKIPASNSKGTVLVCGGYDSFIEEFVLQVRDLAMASYDVILFEGPGQGRCLREGLYFRFDFEKATSAIIDYFKLKKCAIVGISWGGYFALRSAAFEKRITAAIAYDIMDNGFEVMTNIFPPIICKIIRLAYCSNNKKLINILIGRLRNRSILANWAISQGMYITGTKTAFEFYKSLSQHSLKGITSKITQNVLLLAGEKDHYIPLNQFYRLCRNLKHAKSLSYRLFTQVEGGEQHCQVGSHMLAVNEIIDWLDIYFNNNVLNKNA